ncbi:endonuclease [Mycolicibacterium aichiense]|uniref:Endonuclease n=1 Tax=Mycolicibacterium aichiense TaxID=1799 RepID=A0AAD1MC44_9MYCO|nr:endonuclease [Mycolicibacterium aichiense]MCV7019571.1 endonuclease [Mycolicibacterium aichiense]BBX08118.1 endonuclease [Mycolicibacterium aichiense]STZ81923.1 endonuclease [Mycolicibacterium aichiense]
MDDAEARRLIQRLRQHAGRTYAAEAGITLRDTPMPLFQLLVLCMLASKPIDAGIAMQAARELFRAGLRTPRAVMAANRQTMIDAFARANYVRYDESSASRLTELATRVNDDYRNDLRTLARITKPEVKNAKQALKQFTGIGDTGSDIFLREVQDVWPWVRPFFDKRSLDSAEQLGLPRDPDKLAALTGRAIAPLAAGLVRVSLDDDVRQRIAG